MQQHTTEPTQPKVCTKCGEKKEIEFFGKDKSLADGLRSSCTTCYTAYQRTYYASNAERERERARVYLTTDVEKKRKRQRENSRVRYAKNPDKAKECSRAWQTKNPDKARELERRRRARKAKADGSHTIADMRRQYKAQKGLCWWCIKPVAWEDRHDDHLVPLSKGGTDWPNNMVVSCAHCNLSKHDKLPDEFSGRLF